MEGGAVEDEVALELGVDKNELRRKHIRALRQGRETRRQQQTATKREKLSKREEELRRACFAGFGTKWESPDGRSRLQQNRTRAEAEEHFQRLRARLWSRRA
jgi:hypothetical protein